MLRGLEYFLPMFLVFILSATAFGIVYIVITARNKERLAMTEKGIDYLRHKSTPGRSQWALKWGIIIASCGLGIWVGNILGNVFHFIRTEPAVISMLFIFGGLGLVLYYYLLRKSFIQDNNDSNSIEG